MTRKHTQGPHLARRPKAPAPRGSAAETLLRDIAAGVSARVGEDFFRSRALYLAKTLGAELAFVGQLTGAERQEIETLSVCRHGRIVENLRYDLAGTPCERGVRERRGRLSPGRAAAELERLRAEEALRASERNLARAQKVARIGSWRWEIPTNRVTWSEETYRLFGTRPEAETDVWAVIERSVHPEDKPRLAEGIRARARAGTRSEEAP